MKSDVIHISTKTLPSETCTDMRDENGLYPSNDKYFFFKCPNKYKAIFAKH